MVPCRTPVQKLSRSQTQWLIHSRSRVATAMGQIWRVRRSSGQAFRLSLQSVAEGHQFIDFGDDAVLFG